MHNQMTDHKMSAFTSVLPPNAFGSTEHFSHSKEPGQIFVVYLEMLLQSVLRWPCFMKMESLPLFFLSLVDIFPLVIPSGGYPPGITEKEYNIWSGAQFLCSVTPTDGSFTEMWDSPSSYLGVPYFCKALILGALPYTNSLSSFIDTIDTSTTFSIHALNNTEDIILQIVFGWQHHYMSLFHHIPLTLHHDFILFQTSMCF